VYAAAVRLALGDTTFADTALARIVQSGRDPDAWLLSGLVAAKRGDDAHARSLLLEAIAAGADTAEGRAALAAVAARERRWGEVETGARAAFAAARGTLRHPYPREFLSDALTRFALDGPPRAADSLMQAALASRNGWSKLHELAAAAALHAGLCDEAVRQFLVLLEFGIERDEGPELVMRCRHAGL